VFGSIEAGGTNFVCGVGTCPGDLIHQEFPTASPGETIERTAAFFAQYSVNSLGVGCFGPIDIAAGRITTTPKTAWQQFAIVDALRHATGIQQIAFDTDVNAAALGEYTWGSGVGIADFLYLTVGTGIGGGAMINGQLLHGQAHPEMGHIRIRHDRSRDPFPGACYAHGDCLEGLASGAAITKRWQQPGANLPPDHEAWVLETDYLADALATFSCAFSPIKIIVGGGVMKSISYATLNSRLTELLNGYIAVPEVLPPALGELAGVLGGIALASNAYGTATRRNG
jgi:fructokinase